jgi:hypothetical protein
LDYRLLQFLSVNIRKQIEIANSFADVLVCTSYDRTSPQVINTWE